MTRRSLLALAEEARAAVRESLPVSDHDLIRKTLIGMCAVVSVETARRLKLAGRNPLIEFRLSLFHGVQHFWVYCDGHVIDGTSWQLGGCGIKHKPAPLVYVSPERRASFFWYERERSWKTAQGVERFIRQLGWSGPSAALLVHKESEAA